MLAEYGRRACVIGGTESPPPGGIRQEVVIDTSGLVEMAGIHQFGGKVVLGANTPHDVIARASLVRMNGTCLAEACEDSNHPSASLLLYDFWPDGESAPVFPVRPRFRRWQRSTLRLKASGWMTAGQSSAVGWPLLILEPDHCLGHSLVAGGAIFCRRRFHRECAGFCDPSARYNRTSSVCRCMSHPG